MLKIKSHKTVEQIAKKHRLSVDFIQNQLDMGEPIEHEHTKDHILARDIALQHLDEIPDYYTRLKKMESSAKREHKKVKDVKEHCGCEEDAVEDLEVQLKGLKNTSYDSIDKLMRSIMKKHNITAKQLHNSFVSKHKKTPDDWINSLSEESKSGDKTLRDWFKKSSGRDPKTGKKVQGWVQLGGPFAGAPCARQPGQKSTPKCGSSKMAANLSDKEEERAFRRKNKKDPNQPEKTDGAKPTNVRTEEIDLQEKKKESKKDACYNKVKSRYDVFPSAYASGALVQCRKKGAANWGTKSEETMHEEKRYCPLCDKRESRSECSYGEKAWDKVSVKDHEYSMARSELSTIEDAIKRLKKKVGKGEGNLEAWVQSKITKAADYIDTVADYVDSGEMEEAFGYTIDPESHKKQRTKEKIRTISQRGSTEGERSAASSKLGQTPELPKIKKEETIVDKILDEIIVEKCWPGYKKKGMKKMFGKKYPNCVKAENVSIEDANGNTFAEVIDLIKPEPIKGFKSQVNEATRLQSQTGNVIAVTLSWRGKYYALRMFFPQVRTPTRKEINDELQKVYPGSIVIGHNISEIQPGQPLIQVDGYNGGSRAKFGPNRNYVKPMGEEVEVYEDWQKENRRDKTDGLSPKAVRAYRRENPGSNLQTAVTEKNPSGKRKKRRKSYCSRSAGQRDMHNIDCTKTPDKPICKARKRWKC